MRDNRFDKRSSFRFESTSSDQRHYFPLCSITTANRNINSHLSLSQLSLPFYTENVPRKTPNTGNIYTDILHAIQAVCEPSDLYCSQSYSPVYTDNTHTQSSTAASGLKGWSEANMQGRRGSGGSLHPYTRRNWCFIVFERFTFLSRDRFLNCSWM